MGNKVDISEVIELSDDLKTATADLKSSLNQVEENIDKLGAMRSFSGKTAKEAKNYFNDLHKTLLKSFEILFTDLDEHLKKHLISFQSRVDASESAIIENNYLMDTEEEVNDDYNRLSEEQESIRQTIASVSDISSANHPSTTSLNSDHRSAIKTITDLEGDLESYTSAGRQEISKNEELLHHIEAAIKNAGAVPGDGRFNNYMGSSKSVGLLALRGYNEERRDAVIGEAKEAKETAIKATNQSSSEEVINLAYKEFVNGDIDEKTYYAILSSVRKTNGSINVDELKDGESKILVEYLEDRQMLNQYVNDNQNFGEYLLGNLPKIGWEATPGTLAIFAERLGLTMKDVAKYLGDDPVSLKKASKELLDKAGKILKYGKAVGPLFATAGFSYGMYGDIVNNDKTAGEAVAHNVTSLAAGIGGATVIGLLVSNPVGWGAAGIVVAGVGATMVFEYAYSQNFLGFQDGLDWVGQQADWAGEQIDNGWNTVKNWGSDATDAVGNALKSGFDAINPFS